MDEIQQARIDAVQKVTDILKREAATLQRQTQLLRGVQWSIGKLEAILAAAREMPGVL